MAVSHSRIYVQSRQGPASLVIPMIDFEKGRPENGILDEYLWPPSNIGAWDEANRVDLYLTGIASMTNKHEFLANGK